MIDLAVAFRDYAAAPTTCCPSCRLIALHELHSALEDAINELDPVEED